MIEEILHILHILIFIVVTTGAYILPDEYLKYWIIFMLFLILQWIIIDKCALTIYQNKITTQKQENISLTGNILKKMNLYDQRKNIYRLIDINLFVSIIYAFYQINKINYGIGTVSIMMFSNLIKGNSIFYKYDEPFQKN